MTWLALIVLLILRILLGSFGLREFVSDVVFGEPKPKNDVVRSYHICKPTFIKWMEVLHPELWLGLKSNRKNYSSLELFLIHGALGEPVSDNLIISKSDLQSRLSISSKTLKKSVKKRLEEVGLTLEQYARLTVYPPRIAEDILRVCA